MDHDHLQWNNSRRFYRFLMRMFRRSTCNQQRLNVSNTKLPYQCPLAAVEIHGTFAPRFTGVGYIFPSRDPSQTSQNSVFPGNDWLFKRLLYKNPELGEVGVVCLPGKAYFPLNCGDLNNGGFFSGGRRESCTTCDHPYPNKSI